MHKYNIDSLNEEQKKALFETQGAVLVTAGAGSGKTRLLTHRIVYLIEQKNVDPFNILAITFTNKAANEMSERVNEMLESKSFVWISTFHSLCSKILRRDIEKIGMKKSFSIYSESDSDKLLDQILKNFGIDADDKKSFKKKVKFHISNRKNNNFSLQEYQTVFSTLEDIQEIIKVMESYQQRLTENNALDFDDLLTKTYELLKTNPELLEYYSNRFQYILVDEYQDTNFIQYELIKLFGKKHKNIFVVGDEDQCIYTWRGASYENMARFKKDYNAKVFKLEINYRSTPNILSLANNVISNNSLRIEKTLKSVKNEGVKPEFFEAYDEQSEANFVCKKIFSLMKEKNYQFSDFAVLMRVNAISLPFEQSFLSNNIPHKIYGGFKFFERAEIKNVLSYLKLFVNPEDEIALLRVINFPKRGIGEGAISKIKEIAIKERKSLFEIMKNINDFDLSSQIKKKVFDFFEIFKGLFFDYENLPLCDFVSEVVKRFAIKSAYDQNIDEEYYKTLNIDQLIASISEFSEKNTDGGLSEFLESVTLVSDADTMDNSNNVTIATIHAVKGLEFKVVFIVGVEEKLFPISRAFDNPKDMEEERRLMYVAITRAEEQLFLSYTSTRYLYGRREFTKISRFLKEAGYKPIFKTPVVEEFEYSKKSMPDFKGSVFGNSVLNVKNKLQEQTSKESLTKDISQFKVGQAISHTKYGKGEIISIEGRDADIRFEGFGVKTLILDLAPISIIPPA